MANLLKHLPDEEQLLHRSLDEIGGCILQALVEERANNLRYKFHPKNEISGCFPAHGGRYRHETWNQLQHILMEAFSWLQVEGLVAETPEQSNTGWQFVTRRGLAAASDFGGYRSGKGLDREHLVEPLSQRAWPLFIAGQFDAAIMQAFKEVEIAVRSAGGFRQEDYGVDLMRRAFNPEKGQLTDARAPAGERDALASLFSGAIGYFKNPQSHRNVGTIDPRDAVELIMLANHLLRVIASRSAN